MTKSSIHIKDSNYAVTRIAAIFLFSCCLYCYAIAQKKVALRFTCNAGNELLQIGNNYTNASGEIFTVHKFKFYIHNIQIADSTKQFSSIDKKHYLIDAADTASAGIKLNNQLKKKMAYIRFTIGVDSLMNTSGVQTGVLDPLKGMFWTWNTGYIYAKLEGRSNVSRAPGHSFSFDVGGYKPAENAVRIITLPVADQNVIIIKADILKWFAGANSISIAAQPICHEPGKLALQLADNYVNMFSVANAHY